VAGGPLTAHDGARAVRRGGAGVVAPIRGIFSRYGRVRSGAGLDVIFFLQNGHRIFFVVIWQILSNHGIIRLKRFVSSILSKLCN
jgi:hypothetical protein